MSGNSREQGRAMSGDGKSGESDGRVASLEAGEGEQSNNTRGIVTMLAAMATFACGDMLMKLAAETVPTGELVFMRGVLMFTAALIFATMTGALKYLWRLVAPPMLARAIGDVGGALSFQGALARMPFADLVAINQTNPLLVTAASAVFLSERVGWRRWTATGIGFLGVLLIIQPGTTGFTWWSILALVGVFFATMRDVATKRIDNGVPTVLILLTSTGVVTLGSLTLLPFETWLWPEPIVLLKVFGSAVFSLVGQVCIISSVRMGDLSAVVPFRFSIVIWAMIGGYLIWGTLPDALTVIGITVVISAGLYTFHRELVLRRKRSLPVHPS
jgi:drug/metabolite transporter (DMT)-like permease